VTSPAVIFAGGGTGGHLFPALAVADQLLQRDPGAHLRFLCSQRAIDTQILRAAGVDFEPVPARELSLRPLRLLRFLRAWGPSLRAGRRAIRALREEHEHLVVVAMGGFVCAPVALAARAERAPLLLVNLDAAPGKANRWVARHANRCLSAARSPDVEARNWQIIPPIVRAAAVGGDPADCRRRLGLRPDVPTLLVTGASQGASSINDAMIALVETHADALRQWQIFHQTGARVRDGRSEVERVREACERAGVAAQVVPFCDDMGAAWGAADVAVSRAGAGSVGEAWANATPTIFLPYPWHRDEHQRRNAEPLEHAGGAVILRDTLDAARTAESIAETLLPLLRDPAKRDAMRRALASLGPADGARRVAEAIFTESRRTIPAE
jgi:UDP-N-acetylglucosamine--N-acetylmuramyl-(pentapeptide) pyrophosphoryl-undecaprenol N-acetylglucosamine transferase